MVRASSSGRLRLVVACVVAAITFAGCSGAPELSRPNAGGGADESWAQYRSAAQQRINGLEEATTSVDLSMLKPLPAGAGHLAGKKVLLIPFSGTALGPLAASVSEALGPTGAQVQTCDPKGNPSEVYACFGVAKSIGADMVMTMAVSPTVFGNAYNDLEAAGIPVIGAWQEAEGFSENSKRRFLSSSQSWSPKTNWIYFDYVVANADSPPSILQIGSGDNPTRQAISKSLNEYLRKNCGPQCDITFTTQTSANASQVKDLVSSHLVTHPKTDWILPEALEIFGPPTVEGVVNSGSKVRIGGSGSVVAMPLLKAGRIDVIGGISWNFAGYVLTDALLRLASGSPPVAAADYPMVYRLFTAKNIASIDLASGTPATFTWYGEPAFKKAFFAAWGVG